MEIKERQVIENVHRHELTSEEREIAILELWDSGNYKLLKDLGNILGFTPEYIGQLIKAKSTRENLNLTKVDLVSTKTIQEIGRIENPIERKQVAKKIIDPNSSIPSKTVRKLVGTIKELSK